LPWKLLASRNGFVSYLSAYSVFLSSIAGVMVRLKVRHRVWKGHYRMKDLYDTRRDGWYWYTYGSILAYTAYIAGILINVVGLGASEHFRIILFILSIYEMSFFTGFGTSMVIYLLLNWAFPVPGGIGEKSASFEEVDIS
ncbi:hypothetical protein DFJ43DRAFT_961704, partial [Lentinula guzmanii]